jgi:hypothetical protein
VPLRAAVAHASEVGILRFLAENCLNAKRQTEVWPGGAGSSKGQHSSLGSATKYWAAREIPASI